MVMAGLEESRFSPEVSACPLPTPMGVPPLIVSEPLKSAHQPHCHHHQTFPRLMPHWNHGPGSRLSNLAGKGYYRCNGILHGKFQWNQHAMASTTTKNFHLPLPASLYAGLREAATRAGAPATSLAREAIEAWLKEERRRRQRSDLADFVEANAGSTWDLEPQWEAVALASLDKLLPWPDKSLAAGKPKATAKPVVKRLVKRAPARGKAVV